MSSTGKSFVLGRASQSVWRERLCEKVPIAEELLLLEVSVYCLKSIASRLPGCVRKSGHLIRLNWHRAFALESLRNHLEIACGRHTLYTLACITQHALFEFHCETFPSAFDDLIWPVVRVMLNSRVHTMWTLVRFLVCTSKFALRNCIGRCWTTWVPLHVATTRQQSLEMFYIVEFIRKVPNYL